MAQLLQAMAAGRPVVSSELGTGTSQVSPSARSGLVVPKRDPEALAAALGVLLADRERRQHPVARGRERVENHALADLMVVRTLGVHRQVVAETVG